MRILLARATVPAGLAVALATIALPAAAAPDRPADTDGTVQVCQAMTNDLSTDSYWNFVVTPKGLKKAVAGGLVPNGTKNYPACRAILLPAGSYTVRQTPKKGQPVVQVVVKGPAEVVSGAGRTVKPKKGKALTSVSFVVKTYQTTQTIFYNKKT